jgi:hypothetical protein
MNIRNCAICQLGFFSLLLVSSSCCWAADWPPPDPKEYTTETDFTLAWAKKLNGFHTLGELQRAAKAKGTISDQSLDGENPSVSFHWRSEPPTKDNVGYMLAKVSRDGSIAVSIVTTDNHEVILNTEGFFTVEH